MALVLGLNAASYLNSGTTATPVWEEITLIKDESINMQTALADVTTRGGNGWRLQVGTLSEGTVDAQLLYDTANAQFTDIQTAFFAKDRLLMGFFDGDVSASGTYYGLMGGFSVTNFTQSRNLEEALMIDVTFTVRENEVGGAPTWATIVTA